MLSQKISSKSLCPSIFLVAAAVATIVILGSLCLATESKDTKLRADLVDLEPCVMKSISSFQIDQWLPPTNTEALKESCKRQLEGFKCVKEKSKQLPSILKRAFSSMIQARQRHHKKICTNVNSGVSQTFVKDMKCIYDKKLASFKEFDVIFTNKLIEIYRRNFNDSAIELKFLCCSVVTYKKSITNGTGPECTKSTASIEELMSSIITQDLDLICEDEEKLLTKICPSLPQMNVSKKYNNKPGLSASVTALYLVATLGEAQETAPEV